MWPQGICFDSTILRIFVFSPCYRNISSYGTHSLSLPLPTFIAWSCSGWVARPRAGREAAESEKRYWPDKIIMQYREHWSCLFEFKLTCGAAVTLSVPELCLSIRHGGVAFFCDFPITRNLTRCCDVLRSLITYALFSNSSQFTVHGYPNWGSCGLP
jgi:hypothetical protein